VASNRNRNRLHLCCFGEGVHKTERLFYQKHLLSQQQYGFRNNHSHPWLSQICTNTFSKTSIKKLYPAWFSYSTSKKGIDSVNHSMLLKKLEQCGVRGNVFKQSYLSDRKQYIQEGNTKSPLGPPRLDFKPLSFLLFINHLPHSNFIKTMLFADDTVLVQSDNNLGNLKSSLNCEMTHAMDWLTANKLSLSISKTKYMVITNKHVEQRILWNKCKR